MLPPTDSAQSGPKRRLVTVRRITKVTPISGSRRSIFTVGGWNVVAKRSEGFSQDQLVVYVEIDSFLPNNSQFWEYCAGEPTKFHDGSTGFLVKTTMVGRHLSQGLIFDMHDFPVITTTFDNLKSKHNGDEEDADRGLLSMSFEEVLGVRKWQSPEEVDGCHTPGQAFTAPPVFFPQPGCERAQNIARLFEDHGRTKFQITQKLDGLPMSVYTVQRSSQWYAGLPRLAEAHMECAESARVGICNPNQDIPASEGHTPSPWFWRTAQQQGILSKIGQVGKNVAVQGELCGSSILGNSMGFDEGEHRFYVFNIYDIDKQKYLSSPETVRICKKLGWDHVPVVSSSSALRDFAKDVDDLLRKAEGVGIKGRKREGFVFKALHSDFCFKAISNSWLLEVGKR